MKIGITGGTGFIGQHLASRLAAERHEVRVLTRRADLHDSLSGNVKVVRGDLKDGASLCSFVDGLDVLYHCAGELVNVRKMRALHVDGTKRLLSAVEQELERSGKSLHWVQLSSVGAYGPPGHPSEERRVTEESPERPVGEYEVTKTESDALVRTASQANKLLTATFLRPSNVFGCGMSSQALYGMAYMISRGLFFYIGRYDSVATYVHVDDVIEALLLCGLDERAKGETFILSNDYPMREVVDAIADALSVRRPRLWVPEAPVRFLVKALSPLVRLPLTNDRIDALMKRTYYPSERIAKRLGFRLKRDVPAAVAELVVSRLLQRATAQHP